MLALLSLLACSPATPELEGDDTAATEDTAPTWPEGLRELSALSSDQCPDMSGGTSTFLSSDEERRVTMIVPETTNADTAVVFFLHGLMDPQSTPNPTSYMARNLDFQSLADDKNAIIVLPESPLQERFGMSFFLWDVERTSDNDLVLFDDLRTCLYDTYEPDMQRLSVAGLSGGALFTTVMISERGDALASAVSMSGGADLDVAISEVTVAPYSTPAWNLPVLMATGGELDVWPDPQFPIVDFVAGTDTLQGNLAQDGIYGVRCRHNEGHTITWDEYYLAMDWVLEHRFGEPSPWQAGDIAVDSSWCEEI